MELEENKAARAIILGMLRERDHRGGWTAL
jgi:hypothetical protein